MNNAQNPYAGHRYPAEIISHTVRLYFRFTLSYRDVEELLAARGRTGLGILDKPISGKSALFWA
jgi:transposase-like protein